MEAGKEASKDWDKEALRRWIQMEPRLSEVDLSDYFWLVRDRLATSLVGLSLIPPAVRSAYAALLSETGRKQATTLLKELRQDELDGLTTLLEKHLQRDPKDPEAYRGFCTCAEIQPSTFPAFARVIKSLPAVNLPGWLSGNLELLAKGNTSLQNDTKALLDYLSKQTEGRAAKAAQLKRGRESWEHPVRTLRPQSGRMPRPT